MMFLWRSVARSRGLRRLRVMRRRRRRRQDRAVAKLWKSRSQLWHLPRACRRVEDLLYWKAFLQKVVHKIDLRLQVPMKESLSRPKPGLMLREEQRIALANGLDEQLLAKQPEEVLCIRFGAELTRRHLSCLLPDQWLNDEAPVQAV
ncbi:unnamed protein product [Symbiodinium natans]|uniref:Uncharacterized protein n=1 Tax=Symbiodinium natans TaxID=878477 RepID=A0A812U3V1_9DINO|nr:unnamed protein product [Symbiodinium natans]